MWVLKLALQGVSGKSHRCHNVCQLTPALGNVRPFEAAQGFERLHLAASWSNEYNTGAPNVSRWTFCHYCTVVMNCSCWQVYARTCALSNTHTYIYIHLKSAWTTKRAPSCLFCWGLTSLKMLGCGRFVRHWFYTTHILTFVPICAKRSSSVHTKAAPAAHCINVYLHHRTSDHFSMTPVWDCSCISCAISRLPAGEVLACEWDLLARIARHLKGCQPPLPLKPPTNRLDPDRYDMVRHALKRNLLSDSGLHAKQRQGTKWQATQCNCESLRSWHANCWLS